MKLQLAFTINKTSNGFQTEDFKILDLKLCFHYIPGPQTCVTSNHAPQLACVTSYLAPQLTRVTSNLAPQLARVPSNLAPQLARVTSNLAPQLALVAEKEVKK